MKTVNRKLHVTLPNRVDPRLSHTLEIREKYLDNHLKTYGYKKSEIIKIEVVK